MHSRQNEHSAPVKAPTDALAASEQESQQVVNKLEALQTETVGLLRKTWQLAGWAINQELQYPYDEIALDKGRADMVEQLLEKLSESGYRGKIVLETHVGEFCLLGNQQDSFSLPPPDLTVDKCEFVGNPVQPSDSPAAHQSLRFANFINSTPLLNEDELSLEVDAASRTAPLYDYPEKSDATTAQAWNLIAAKNNRVVIRLKPASRQ